MGWLKAMRILLAARARIPARQLTLFESGDGWCHIRWVTNRPGTTRVWLGQPGCIDAAHRVHARVEVATRTGERLRPRLIPSGSLPMNKACLSAALIAVILLARLRLLAIDGALGEAEPKPNPSCMPPPGFPAAAASAAWRSRPSGPGAPWGPPTLLMARLGSA